MKAELRIAGTSLMDIARNLGVTDGAVSQVGKRISRFARIEAALAEALGMTPEELFPISEMGKIQRSIGAGSKSAPSPNFQQHS